MSDATLTKAQLIERITLESQQRGFIEYPKMLHHPDGRQLTVTSKREEEDALRGEWTPSPDDALKVKTKRDEAERQRVALANAEAVNQALLDTGKAAKTK